MYWRTAKEEKVILKIHFLKSFLILNFFFNLSVTRVRSQGHVNLKFNIVTKDVRKLGYLTNQSEASSGTQMNEINTDKLLNLTQNLGYTMENTLTNTLQNTNQTPRF